MEILLIVGVVSVIVLNALLIAILLSIFKFIKDLHDLLETIGDEADRLRLSASYLLERINRKSSLLVLLVSALGKRKALKKMSELFVNRLR